MDVSNIKGNLIKQENDYFDTEFIDTEFPENGENKYMAMEFIDNGKGEACASSLRKFKLGYDDDKKTELWFYPYTLKKGQLNIGRKYYHHSHNKYRYSTLSQQMTDGYSHTLTLFKKKNNKNYNFKIYNKINNLTYYYKVLPPK